jgi:hypothetical protein
VYWLQSLLTLLLPLALLPFVLVWLWRALRRMDARLAEEAREPTKDT